MNLRKLKLEGIYFRQSDARIDGYYTSDSEGNLEKNEYKITLKDKLKYLAFNKKPFNPISTSYLSFRFFENKLMVISGSMSGDAITVAKSVKNHYRSNDRIPYELKENSIVVDYGTAIEELQFDEDGKNISCKLTKKEPGKTKSLRTYSFINWHEL